MGLGLVLANGQSGCRDLVRSGPSLTEKGQLWRHLLFGPDGDSRFKSLDGSRLEYKLDSRKLD